MEVEKKKKTDRNEVKIVFLSPPSENCLKESLGLQLTHTVRLFYLNQLATVYYTFFTITLMFLKR